MGITLEDSTDLTEILQATVFQMYGDKARKNDLLDVIMLLYTGQNMDSKVLRSRFTILINRVDELIGNAVFNSGSYYDSEYRVHLLRRVSEELSRFVMGSPEISTRFVGMKSLTIMGRGINITSDMVNKPFTKLPQTSLKSQQQKTAWILPSGGYTSNYTLPDLSIPQPKPEPEGESTMALEPLPKDFDRTKHAVETRTFIFGKPAEDVSDEQLYATLVQLESEIKHLKSIEAKSSKLEASIKGLHADVASVVEFLDERK